MSHLVDGGAIPQRRELRLGKPRWHKNSAVGDVPSDDTKRDGDDSEPVAIVCARCGHAVTYPDQSCEVEGLHAHTQINPGGYVWNFRCFHSAPGARPAEPPTTEFSWFRGCSWQLAHCADCDLHLGWRFCGERQFVGLISERIVTRQ